MATGSMPTKDRIEEARDDPAALETLYRQALQRGQERAFKAAIAQLFEGSPEDVLLSAWACRLDLDDPSAGAAPRRRAGAGSRRHWGIAVVTSIGCGALFALFAGDKPPVPIPGEASPLFWIGWGPLTAVGVLVFIAAVAPEGKRPRWCAGAATVAIIAGLLSALAAWGRTDDTATLIALHLPFVAWSIVGASVTLRHADRARQFYAFIVESMEAIVAGGIYLFAGLVFGGLTVGIFAVLGLELSQDVLRVAAAFGIGVIPVLAVASVYDPASTPAEQSPATGLARILKIMTWLLLPLALGVLALYVFWFIPAYFWRPFNEREALIVYNATIIAILALLAAAVSGADDRRQRREGRVLRLATLSLGALTLLLNIYALAAMVSRTLEHGLTPNRHAVLGWNTVTLLMLAFLLARSWSVESDDWLRGFGASLARAMVLAVGWASWVVWGIPLFSHA